MYSADIYSDDCVAVQVEQTRGGGVKGRVQIYFSLS